MDIELMHYLINPEKSHKIEILAKTYLDINIEENSGMPNEEATLSLFDEVPEEDTAPGRYTVLLSAAALRRHLHLHHGRPYRRLLW